MRLPEKIEQLDLLDRTAPPNQSLLDEYRVKFQNADNHARELQERKSENARARIECTCELEAIEHSGDVPTEAELEKVRKERDQKWMMIRKTFHSTDPSKAELEVVCRSFETLVQKADDLADRLRRETERIQRKGNLLARLSALDSEDALIAGRIAEIAADHEKNAAQWRALWSPIGVEPGQPSEMIAWLADAAALRTEAQSYRDSTEHLNALEQTLETKRNQLAAALKRAKVELSADSTFESLRVAAKETLERQTQALASRKATEKQIKAARADLEAADHALKAKQAERAAWESDWGRTTSSLELFKGLPPDVSKTVVDRMNDLVSNIDNCLDHEREVATFDSQADEWKSVAKSLLLELAEDLAAIEPHAALRTLSDRLSAAKEAVKLQEKIRAGKDQLALIDSNLQAIYEKTGCRSIEAVEEAITRYRSLTSLERERGKRSEEILNYAGGKSIEDFLCEVEEIDAELAAQKLEDLKIKRDAESERLDQLNQEIGRLEAERNSLASGSGAIDPAQEAEDARAEIERLIETYTPLKLAHAVLGKFIAHYREQNQGPVLPLAEAYFKKLTHGGFERLFVDEGEKGGYVLRAQRSGGRNSIGRSEMSEGTADQLYLALRLGSIVHHLEGRESVPLILDDILIAFDDNRSAAVLELLSEISQKTQILFFTHHRHLLELANKRLPEGAFRVHELSPGKAMIAGSS